MDSYVELLIQNGEIVYQPVIEGEIIWETERKGTPGKLTFNVLNDGIINFQEGNRVTFAYNGEKIFYGFVFNKSRDKSHIIKVVAYDQLRYFKNKETFVYKNKTAGGLLKKICNEFRLKWGNVEDTQYVIASRVEDNTTLFDIMQNALDLTLQNKGKMYVLYDDFGNLALRDVESLKLDLIINEETAQDFDYKSSIDGETYNKIKLSYENKETGKREIYIAKDGTNINKWGVLQYFDTIDEKTNGKAKADALLKLYNDKTRNLSIKDAFGDVRVRGGSSVIVCLNLGDINVRNYMLVEKVKHTFSSNLHTMDLTLRGETKKGVNFSA